MRRRSSRSLGLRQIGLYRESHSLAFQGAVVRLPVALCQVRYCIVRHCGFLVGYGHASGDVSAAPQTIEQALKLLTAPPPWRRQIEPVYEGLAAINGPIDWPAPDSEIEDWIFAASALIFVEATHSERARQALRRTLGGRRVEYLLALLAFIRTAHFGRLCIPVLKSRTTSGSS